MNTTGHNNLMDARTAEPIRAATYEEWQSSVAAAEHDGGAGIILVDGRDCYVEGERWAEARTVLLQSDPSLSLDMLDVSRAVDDAAELLDIYGDVVRAIEAQYLANVRVALEQAGYRVRAIEPWEVSTEVARGVLRTKDVVSWDPDDSSDVARVFEDSWSNVDSETIAWRTVVEHVRQYYGPGDSTGDIAKVLAALYTAAHGSYERTDDVEAIVQSLRDRDLVTLEQFRSDDETQTVIVDEFSRFTIRWNPQVSRFVVDEEDRLTLPNEAVERLMSEGYERANVLSAYNSLIEAGLEAPNSVNALSGGDMAVLRDQLAQWQQGHKD